MARRIDKSELVNVMLRSACQFLESYDTTQIDYYRRSGYVGPDSVKFQPSTGDKMILREMMEKAAETIPENFRERGNAMIFGQKVLFLWYYPQYDCYNRTHQPE